MTKEQEKLQSRIREYKKSLDMVEPVKAIVKAFIQIELMVANVPHSGGAHHGAIKATR